MPSTATTNVTISTLLDLIGPATSATSSDHDQSAFDALLKPLPAAPSPASSRNTDEQPLPSCRQESSEVRRDAPPSAAAGCSSDPSHDKHPTVRQQSGDDESSASPAKENSDGSVSEDEEASELSSALAESLAGLVFAPTSGAADVAIDEESTESTEIEAVAPEVTSARVVANKPKGNEGSAGSANPSAAVDQQKPSPETPHLAALVRSQPQADKKASKQPNEVATASAKPSSEEANAPETITSLHEDAPVLDVTRSASDKGLNLDQPRQSTPVTADTTPITFDPQSQNGSAADLPPINPANPAPPAVSVAAPVQIKEPSPDGRGAPSTNAATTQRWRLPDAFSKSVGPAGRRATVEIDSARLLTRVTRAFAAARERDGEIRLRLSPPELGSLRLDVRVQDGALVARLQTETDAARTAILENLPALRDRLSEQGVRIERFDVDLMQRQPGGMPDQPGGRQQDFPTAPIRAAPSPRARTESPSISSTTVPLASPSDGLNVIV